MMASAGRMDQRMDHGLIVERRGAVAWLTVNRPEVRNALSLALTQHVAQTVRDLSHDRALRVIVLTGAGDRVFVSGADVREFRAQLATPETALRYDAAAEQLQSALREAPQPVIAMIQGHAVGSGTIVAASCDFRIAVRTAKFGIPVARFRLHRSRAGHVASGATRGSRQGEMAVDDGHPDRSGGGAGDRIDR